MRSLFATEEQIISMIDEDIENSIIRKIEEEDPLGYSVYLFFLTRNKINTRAVEVLIDWMNFWVDIILNQRKFSRFVDREFTSAILGYYTLTSINRLKTQVDMDKVVELLRIFIVNGSFFNNFTYTILIMLSMVEQKEKLPEFTRIFEWIKNNVQKEFFFNDGKNLVFTSLLLDINKEYNVLYELVKRCIDRIEKNQIRFDDMIYYAWVLWNYRKFVDTRTRQKFVHITKEVLVNSTRIFQEEKFDEDLFEVYGYDTKSKKFSKIWLSVTLDLVRNFNKTEHEILEIDTHYIENKLNSLGWYEVWKNLANALDAFENERMSECCNDLRGALTTLLVKIYEKLKHESPPIKEGRGLNIGLLTKCMVEHGLSKEEEGMIGSLWSYLSDKVHIEKRGGKEPTEDDVRFALRITYILVERLLSFVSK